VMKSWQIEMQAASARLMKIADVAALGLRVAFK